MGQNVNFNLRFSNRKQDFEHKLFHLTNSKNKISSLKYTEITTLHIARTQLLNPESLFSISSPANNEHLVQRARDTRDPKRPAAMPPARAENRAHGTIVNFPRFITDPLHLSDSPLQNFSRRHRS